MPLNIRPALTQADRNLCYQLRHTVFVEEQGVPVDMELDDHDEKDAFHFLGTENGVPTAASRIVVIGENAKIGRLVVLKLRRGQGYGVAMMQAMLDHARMINVASVSLDAQTHATGFYEGLGFVAQGDEFLDAGIPHRKMQLRF